MSTGTENIVFNRLFDPGTHWDKWVKYPFYPGYSSVGIIEEVGKEVEHLQKGQRVAFREAHRSLALPNAAECYPIPDAVSFEQAVWFALAKITFHGALAARHVLGDSVLIIGAGPIGQMSIRWARAAGCTPIIAVDTAVHRLPLAQDGGASVVVTSPISEAREAVLAAGGGKLPRVVIDSTGNATVFAAALGLAADRGTVVIMGDTGSPTKQALTSDVISRGLTIVGVHDSHNTEEWNGATISRLFFDLVAAGRFPMAGLTSHIFKPEQATEAYVTANRDRASTMGLIFDWTGELKGKK
ncbi:MAG: zinc-binding alcohol dehydrogenase [Methylacidiphilales bacterium]|nr:zinc-binding alcohol dehydrogenase [Candidatus Methylacidiphilales bacterium]